MNLQNINTLLLIKEEVKKCILSLEFIVCIGIILLFFNVNIYLTNYYHYSTINSILNSYFLSTATFGTFYIIGITVKSFCYEIEHQSLQVLLTLPMSRNRIFLSKIFSLFIITLLLLIINLLGILLIIPIFGEIAIIEHELLLLRSIYLILYFFSIITITTIPSIITKRSVVSIIIMIMFFIFMLFISPEISKYYLSGGLLDHLFLILLPYNVLNLEIIQLQRMFSEDIFLLIIQILFIIITLISSLLLFRREDF